MWLPVWKRIMKHQHVYRAMSPESIIYVYICRHSYLKELQRIKKSGDQKWKYKKWVWETGRGAISQDTIWNIHISSSTYSPFSSRENESFQADKWCDIIYVFFSFLKLWFSFLMFLLEIELYHSSPSLSSQKFLPATLSYAPHSQIDSLIFFIVIYIHMYRRTEKNIYKYICTYISILLFENFIQSYNVFW